MPIHLKKSNSFFWFPVVFFILTIGSLGGLCLIKINIRTTVRDKIRSLSDAELVPVEMNYTPGAERDDELLLDGKYYDVVRYCIQGQKIIYYCYYDKAETAIAAFFTGNRFPQEDRLHANQAKCIHKNHDQQIVFPAVVPDKCLQPIYVSFFYRIPFPSRIPGDVSTPPPQGLIVI